MDTFNIWFLGAAVCFFVFWLVALNRRKQLMEEREKTRDRHRSELVNIEDQAEKAMMFTTKENEDKVNNLQEEFDRFKVQYSAILDEEAKVKQLTDEGLKWKENISKLKVSYATKKEIFDRLSEKVAIYDDRLAFAELGVYEPHFDLQDSAAYKAQIMKVRDQQKEMVSQKTACTCPTDWTVEGSLSKGKTMMNRQTRLTLRAFNKECEAAISNARWNNVVAMEKRILAAEKAINKENVSLTLELNDKFVALKLDELHATHEYRERQKTEKDERAEISRLQRDEAKLLSQAAKAEAEEKKYQKLLDAARKEAGVDEGRIAELEAALSDAHEESERAKAMAEITKSGYIYIISNVGSFGADIVKIGMTRRLDPNDRVKELGDASVPFTFDTHAMIYSEEAPALEAALHKEFADRRVNMSNMRKEFFRVNIDEVESAVKRLAPDVEFFKDRDAQEWFETLARRQELIVSLKEAGEDFPEAI